TLPNRGSKFLPRRSLRDEGSLSLAICLEFCSLCHFLHPAQPLLMTNQSSIQDLRAKLLLRIEEIKKDLPKKLLFLLVGFYSATAFSSFIGKTGDWDVLSAALAVIVVECIGALMYRASIPLINKTRSVVTMFNYWKTGLALGLFLDSFKYEFRHNKSFKLL
ncbi:hypothetical protein N665_1584s0009, partial [Sinapis alba]